MRSLSDELAQIAPRIIQIAVHQRLGRTSLNARGQEAILDSLDTEVALLHRSGLPFLVAFGFVRSQRLAVVTMRVFGKEANLIGAGHNASAAANTLALIHHHQIVFFPLMAGAGRTNGNTGRIHTMIAADG